MAAFLNETMDRSTNPFTEDQLEVLQQRTHFGRQQPRGQAGQTMAISVCLAILRGPDSANQSLALFEAARMEGETAWEIVGAAATPIGNPPLKPLVTVMSVAPRVSISYGATVYVPEAASIQLRLANGVIAEDRVSNGSMLLFVPFDSSRAWERDADLSIMDVNGNEILSGSIRVSPERPDHIEVPQRPPR